MSSILERLLNNKAEQSTYTGKPKTPAPQSGVKASQNAKDFYIRVCTERKMEPIAGYEDYSPRQLSAEIKNVQKIEVFKPASDPQCAKIKGLQASCRMKVMEDKDIKTRSVGQASEYIQKLQERFEKKFSHLPTPKQMEMIENMKFVPDIAWEEELGFIDDVLLEELELAQTELRIAYKNSALSNAQVEVYKNNVIAINSQIDEEKKQVNLIELTKDQCDEFIKKNQQVYYRWLNDRATFKTLQLLNSLRTRNGDPAFTDVELLAFDKNTADEFIKNLQIHQGEIMKFPAEPEINDGRGKNDPTIPNTPENVEQADMEKLEKCIISLYVVIGQDDFRETLETDTDIKELLTGLVELASDYTSALNIAEICEGILSDAQITEITGKEIIRK